MKTVIYGLLLASVVFFATSCNTYYVASTDTQTNLYEGSGIAYTVPVGTILLLKGRGSNGYVKARYHSNPKWFLMANSSYSLVPGFNPKYYNQTYASYEADSQGQLGNANSSGYDATIQTGSRGGKYYINKNGNKTYVKRSTTSGTVKHVGGSRGRH